jgi:hypothetical protein
VLQSIENVGNDGDSEIRFELTLAKTLGTESVTFATGLPGLDSILSIAAGLGDRANATLNYIFQLDFVVQEVAGASSLYIDTAGTEELALGVSVDASMLNVDAALGILKMRMTDNPATPTTLTGALFRVDLGDGGDDKFGHSRRVVFWPGRCALALRKLNRGCRREAAQFALPPGFPVELYRRCH